MKEEASLSKRNTEENNAKVHIHKTKSEKKKKTQRQTRGNETESGVRDKSERDE